MSLQHHYPVVILPQKELNLRTTYGNHGNWSLVCQSCLVPAYERHLASQLLNCWKLKVGHGGCMYTTEIKKHYKSGLIFFPRKSVYWYITVSYFFILCFLLRGKRVGFVSPLDGVVRIAKSALCPWYILSIFSENLLSLMLKYLMRCESEQSELTTQAEYLQDMTFKSLPVTVSTENAVRN